MQHAGRVKVRLAEMLRAAGFYLEPDDLEDSKGYWRMPQQDVMRWDAWAFSGGRTVHICSWSTMSDCVRRGIDDIEQDEDGVYWVEAKG